jgi:protein disulfide-isomerase A1
MNDVLGEKLTPIYKTEVEPAYNGDTVKVVVGTTWDKIVMDKTKDVFVMYYAPWCKYSKEMQMPWIELSQLMEYN